MWDFFCNFAGKIEEESMIQKLFDTNERRWFENDMPEGCPPLDTFGVEGDFYRLVSLPPTEADFIPYSRLFPNKNFADLECQARAISVFKSLDECKQMMKSPAFKSKKVAVVHITPEDGVVKCTPNGQNKSHYSWWRAATCQTINYTILNDE